MIENIDDVAPSFSQSVYRGSLEENSAPVDSILQVLASDPDFWDRFVYAIESGNVNARFSINSTTGVLSSTVELDREEQETYTLIITAADQGGVPLSGTGTCIITVSDVDDNLPAPDSQWSVSMLLLYQPISPLITTSTILTQHLALVTAPSSKVRMLVVSLVSIYLNASFF